MINIVTTFGAQNDGIGSNFAAINSAIDYLITNSGGEIYFPEGVYKIKGNLSGIGPINRTGVNNIKFCGKGAKIICDADFFTGGGGIYLTGDNITIEDLFFEGLRPSDPIGNPTQYGNGTLLRITGNSGHVHNCTFRYGNGSAVNLGGKYHIVESNFFDACDYYPVIGGDYGSIHIRENSQYITIANNKIVNQQYSGISIFDSSSGPNSISHLSIIGNYIRSFSSSTNVDNSMGIYFVQGGVDNAIITNNIIEKMDAEGIMLTSKNNFPAKDCIISNNIIVDCDYRGIALDSSHINGTFSNFTISNNTIRNTSAAANIHHMIWVDRINDSIISGNRCIGLSSQSPKTTRGIVFSNSCPKTVVTGNVVSNLLIGISFFSANGILSDNIASDCSIGLDVSYCLGASVAGNIVKNCATGISTGSDATRHFNNNSVLDCTNRFNTSGAVVPEVLAYTGVTNSSPYANTTVRGTLSAGAGSVSFATIYPEDQFLVIPVNTTTSVNGSLYVTAVNSGTNTVTVRSSLSTDNRSFFVLKFISG